jgi:hypothetical protein
MPISAFKVCVLDDTRAAPKEKPQFYQSEEVP